MTFIKKSKHKAAWIAVIVSLLLVMSLHIYNDILVTGRQSLYLLDSIFSGKFLRFYFDATMTGGSEYYTVVQDALYPLTCYVIFAVWELPLWILEKILKVNLFNTIGGMLYTKGVLVLFLYLCIREFHKLLKLMNKCDEDADTFTLMFVSSLFMLHSLGIAVQYDIFAVYFTLCGISAWLRKDRKTFVIWFAAGITFKYFPFLYFFPLLIIKERNILKIARDTVLALIPSALLFLFPKPEGGLVEDMLYKFFSVSSTRLGFKLPLFPTFVILACCFAFFYRPKEDREREITATSLLIIFGAFLTMAIINPYWAILCVPAFVLLIAVSGKYANIELILETGMCAAVTVKHFRDFYWVYDARNVVAMKIAPALMNIKKDLTGAPLDDMGLKQLLISSGISNLTELIWYGAVALWLLMILISLLNIFRKKEGELLTWLVYVRAAFNLLLLYLPLICSAIAIVRY